MKQKAHTALTAALALLVALLAAGLAYLAIAWADPNDCQNIFGQYQNCHRTQSPGNR